MPADSRMRTLGQLVDNNVPVFPLIYANVRRMYDIGHVFMGPGFALSRMTT